MGMGGMPGMAGMPGMTGMRGRAPKADIVQHKLPCSLEDLYRGVLPLQFSLYGSVVDVKQAIMRHKFCT